MSDRDALTRRGLIAGLAVTALAMSAPNLDAFADEQPFAERFVTFDPPVLLRATPLHDRDGRPRVLVPAPGRISLVALWATWCPACRRDLPRMAAAQRSFARAGFDMAAVNVEAVPLETIRPRAAAIDTGSIPLFFDPDGKALGAPYPDGHRSPLQPFGMPILFVIDRDGRVRGYVKGAVDWSDTTLAPVLRALAEGAVPSGL
jgi:thiol-disulfide isomerase/thioredoxin